MSDQRALFETGPLFVNAIRDSIAHLDIHPVLRALIIDNASSAVRYRVLDALRTSSAQQIEVCLGCGKPTATADCGCPAGTGFVTAPVPTGPDLICPDCGQPIKDGEEVAIVCGINRPSVKVHRRCGKLSTAHGRKVIA